MCIFTLNLKTRNMKKLTLTLIVLTIVSINLNSQNVDEYVKDTTYHPKTYITINGKLIAVDEYEAPYLLDSKGEIIPLDGGIIKNNYRPILISSGLLTGYLLSEIYYYDKEIFRKGFYNDERKHGKHFFGEIAITGGAYIVFTSHELFGLKHAPKWQRQLAAGVVGAAAAAGKEAVDHFTGRGVASMGDVRASLAGIIATQLVLTIPIGRESKKQADKKYWEQQAL